MKKNLAPLRTVTLSAQNDALTALSGNASNAWLPDFSWYNIPKRENIGHKICQMVVKYSEW
jgi:hypothetical protein